MDIPTNILGIVLVPNQYAVLLSFAECVFFIIYLFFRKTHSLKHNICVYLILNMIIPRMILKGEASRDIRGFQH